MHDADMTPLPMAQDLSGSQTDKVSYEIHYQCGSFIGESICLFLPRKAARIKQEPTVHLTELRMNDEAVGTETQPPKRKRHRSSVLLLASWHQ